MIDIFLHHVYSTQCTYWCVKDYIFVYSKLYLCSSLNMSLSLCWYIHYWLKVNSRFCPVFLTALCGSGEPLSDIAILSGFFVLPLELSNLQLQVLSSQLNRYFLTLALWNSFMLSSEPPVTCYRRFFCGFGSARPFCQCFSTYRRAVNGLLIPEKYLSFFSFYIIDNFIILHFLTGG